MKEDLSVGKQRIKAHLITKPLAADNAEPPVPPARCPLSPAVLQGGGGRGVLLHRTPTLAGRVDEKLKNSNKTNLFSSYSEAGNDDLSHTFQIRENTSVIHCSNSKFSLQWFCCLHL